MKRRLPQKQLGVEVQPRQADLAKGIPPSHVDVRQVFEVRDEVAEGGEADSGRYQAEVQGDAEVGLVSDEMGIGPDVAENSRVDSPLLVIEGDLFGADMEKPEVVGCEVPGEWLDEDAIIVPDQVEANVFSTDYSSSLHDLAMERRDVPAVLLGQHPQTRGKLFEITEVEFQLGVFLNFGMIMEFNARLAWKTLFA